MRKQLHVLVLSVGYICLCFVSKKGNKLCSSEFDSLVLECKNEKKNSYNDNYFRKYSDLVSFVPDYL